MIKPCKYCGRSGHKVFTQAGKGTISKQSCAYCAGKGYTIINEKEVKDGVLEYKE
jgi:DnaJ-class molecular chaperone